MKKVPLFGLDGVSLLCRTRIFWPMASNKKYDVENPVAVDDSAHHGANGKVSQADIDEVHGKALVNRGSLC